MPKKKKTTEPTEWEIAKPILLKQYLDGIITDSMMPNAVWKMQPEFTAVPYVNFRTNFRNMKRGVQANRNRAAEDEAGLLRDMTIHKLAKDTPGCWFGSEAKELLQVDMENKRHEHMKPELLWKSRPEYQKFELKKFRGHIHQELRRHRDSSYWLVRRKKLEEAKRRRV